MRNIFLRMRINLFAQETMNIFDNGIDVTNDSVI